MMRDDRQLAAVCCAVCRRIQKDVVLWTHEGPTELAKRWKKRSPLSSGERVLLLVAWTLWNNSTPRIQFSAVIDTLDGDNLVFIGALLVALGSGMAEVDRWLEAQGVRHG